MREKNNYDVIIIGGGPAGVSAALYACRGGLDVCMLHNGATALEKAEKIQNFYGAGTVNGKALYEKGLEQAKEVGAEIINGEVTFASSGDDCFDVITTEGTLSSKKLVIATGASRRTLDIQGIKEYKGKGVSYCAVCDAFFCRNKKVAVIGAGEYAKHECGALIKVAKELFCLTNGEAQAFRADGVKVIEKKIKRVIGSKENGRVSAVEFEDGTTLEVDALFVALGVMNSSAIAKSMGVVTDKSGAIVVDKNGMTNIEGLYAAGDCTAGVKQVAKAVNDGMNVGYSLLRDFKGGL